MLVIQILKSYGYTQKFVIKKLYYVRLLTFVLICNMSILQCNLKKNIEISIFCVIALKNLKII